MVRQSLVFMAIMTVCLAAGSAAWAEPTAVKSRIDAVTVYRGQALVTRVVELPADTGDLQCVVSDLPTAVIGSSLSASADAGGIAVRSVRFRTRAVAAAASKEVADLDTAMKALRHEVFANDQGLRLLEVKGAYLDKLEQFVAPTAQTEMTKGVLNPDTLSQMTKLIYDRRSELMEQRIEQTLKAEELRDRLALLERQRSELSKAAERSVNEAVVFLSKEQAGPATIRLQYLVGTADWSPAYNIRLTADGKTIRMEYLADIRQMSGEDWADVRLTLSTATPKLNAQSPVLGPLWVGLSSPAPNSSAAGNISFDMYAQTQHGVRVQQQKVMTALIQEATDEFGAGWDLNRLAGESQQLELNVNKDLVREGRLTIQAIEEGLAVSYALEGKMSLASRAERQLAQIAVVSLPGELGYEAIPLLTGYVYRGAEVTNSSTLPLLAGPYSAYAEGEFVGTGRLPVIARGQKFSVGFGVDTQLRCRRELLDKADEIAWGNRVQTFRYRLRLENFKDTPVTVRLMDRIPASKTEDIRVELGSVKPALSTDKVYVRDLKPRGILRWDIALPGSAAGAEAVDLEYTFDMKYAKDKAVGKDKVVGQEVGQVLSEMKADYAKAAASAAK
jgi:uncharacterized protein (TIGR02231 family)